MVCREPYRDLIVLLQQYKMYALNQFQPNDPPFPMLQKQYSAV